MLTGNTRLRTIRKGLKTLLVLQVEEEYTYCSPDYYSGWDSKSTRLHWRDATVEDVTQFNLNFPKIGELNGLSKY